MKLIYSKAFSTRILLASSHKSIFAFLRLYQAKILFQLTHITNSLPSHVWDRSAKCKSKSIENHQIDDSDHPIAALLNIRMSLFAAALVRWSENSWAATAAMQRSHQHSMIPLRQIPLSLIHAALKWCLKDAHFFNYIHWL